MPWSCYLQSASLVNKILRGGSPVHTRSYTLLVRWIFKNLALSVEGKRSRHSGTLKLHPDVSFGVRKTLAITQLMLCAKLSYLMSMESRILRKKNKQSRIHNQNSHCALSPQGLFFSISSKACYLIRILHPSPLTLIVLYLLSKSR